MGALTADAALKDKDIADIERPGRRDHLLNYDDSEGVAFFIKSADVSLVVTLVNALPALLDAAEVVANADQEPGLVARYCQQVREIADLRAQLAAMTAKLEIRDPSELDEYITESQRDWDELQAKLTASQARVETLEVALRKYGQHRFACEFNRWDTFGQGKCSCGLKQALAGAGGDK